MERNIRTTEDGARQPLPRRLEATDQDVARARDAAHAVAATALGCDPGPMTLAASMSHYVYIGADVVVKLVDADGHTRLDLEIALAPHLPLGLGAPLLAGGRFQNDTCDVRYACFTRMLGASPGIGLPGVNAATARRWADQAVRRLDDLHTWTPTGDAEKALRESPVEEGFVSRDLLFAEIEHMAAADREAVIPRRLIDGLTAIAERAPDHARAEIPVHADADWGNLLALEDTVTCLIDFERARLGEPADDWVLLAVTSGPHLDIVLDAITDATAIAADVLRTACELRDATFLAEDLRFALGRPNRTERMAQRFRDLDGLVDGRRWWQHYR